MSQLFPRILLLSFALGVTLLGAACGKPKQVDEVIPDPDGLMEPIDARTGEEATQRASRATVTCTDNACHPAIGLVTIVSGRSITACTGFLIAGDVLATNSQCLPEDIRKGDATCKGRVWVTFPEVPGFEAQRVDCVRPLRASTIYPDRLGPNYAFIKLPPRIMRPSMGTDRRGFPDDTLVDIIKADLKPGEGPVDAELTRTSCRTVQNSIVNPTYDDAKRPVVTLGRCNLQQGNAGSPILVHQSDRVAIGIVQASLSLGEIRRQVLQRQGLLEVEPEKLFGATSFACIPGLSTREAAPGVDVLPTEACNPEQPLDSLRTPFPLDDRLELKNRLSGALSSWTLSASTSSRAFMWRINSFAPDADDALRGAIGGLDAGQEVIHGEPLCVRDSSLVRTRPREFNLPALVYRYKLNSLLQKQWVRTLPLKVTDVPVSVALSPAINASPENPFFSLAMSLRSGGGSSVPYIAYDLPRCR